MPILSLKPVEFFFELAQFAISFLLGYDLVPAKSALAPLGAAFGLFLEADAACLQKQPALLDLPGKPSKQRTNAFVVFLLDFNHL